MLFSLSPSLFLSLSRTSQNLQVKNKGKQMSSQSKKNFPKIYSGPNLNQHHNHALNACSGQTEARSSS